MVQQVQRSNRLTHLFAGDSDTRTSQGSLKHWAEGAGPCCFMKCGNQATLENRIKFSSVWVREQRATEFKNILERSDGGMPKCLQVIWLGGIIINSNGSRSRRSSELIKQQKFHRPRSSSCKNTVFTARRIALCVVISFSAVSSRVLPPILGRLLHLNSIESQRVARQSDYWIFKLIAFLRIAFYFRWRSLCRYLMMNEIKFVFKCIIIRFFCEPVVRLLLHHFNTLTSNSSLPKDKWHQWDIELLLCRGIRVRNLRTGNQVQS